MAALNTQHISVTQEMDRICSLEQNGTLWTLEAKLLEYIHESEHAGWDGFTARDLYGIRNFFTDFIIFVDTTKDDPISFD